MYKVIVFYASGTTMTMRFDDIHTAYDYAVALNGILLGGQSK